MGVVYMAEQSEPVVRRVALKIIKPGMDTGQVIARFEAERQALAMMDHPHIARVLDAGQTDAGRPYFVMELVKGVPVSKVREMSGKPSSARTAAGWPLDSRMGPSSSGRWQRAIRLFRSACCTVTRVALALWRSVRIVAGWFREARTRRYVSGR
jgi:serine/threonine protein kinase